jgi:hypothetical protein
MKLRQRCCRRLRPTDTGSRERTRADERLGAPTLSNKTNVKGSILEDILVVTRTSNASDSLFRPVPRLQPSSNLDVVSLPRLRTFHRLFILE